MLFKSAGIVFEHNGLYLVKCTKGRYDLLGGKVEPFDKSLLCTAIRETYEESDGLFDLRSEEHSTVVVRSYVVPDAKYMAFVVRLPKSQPTDHMTVGEGQLEWLDVDQIERIVCDGRERFRGILANIMTIDYLQINQRGQNITADKMLITEIFRSIPLKDAYRTMNRIYDLHINRDDGLILLVYSGNTNQWKHKIPVNKFDVLRENRGTVYHYNEKHEYELVAFGLEKFWRHDDPLHSEVKKVNWDKPYKVQVKYDGYNYKVYNFNGKWYISTNSSIICDSVVLRNSTMRAMECFNECAEEVGFSSDRLDPDRTYVFEVIHPKARLVVPYKKPMLVHLTTRCRKTLKEIDHDIGIPRPETICLKSEQEILEYVDKLSFEQGEGLVLMQDIGGRSALRIKYKATQYKREHMLLETHINPCDAKIKYVIDVWHTDDKRIIEQHHPDFIKVYVFLDNLMAMIREQFESIGSCDRAEYYRRAKKIKNKYVRHVVEKLYGTEITDYKQFLCLDKDHLFRYVRDVWPNDLIKKLKI
jgi:hypothetical protein